jgi:SAM-dependent methyltransferase
MRELIRAIWKRLMLRRLDFNDPHRALNRLYGISDPWEMTSKKEQFRFAETNAFIQRKLGRVGSILEVGCGEGHQSEYLERVAERLVGIDVSSRAVERARTRCPAQTFKVGDVHSVAASERDGAFDLVVACEVLYYMRDVRAALEAMRRLGRSVLVTYYQGQAEALRPVLDEIPGGVDVQFAFESTVWHARLWRHGGPA